MKKKQNKKQKNKQKKTNEVIKKIVGLFMNSFITTQLKFSSFLSSKEIKTFEIKSMSQGNVHITRLFTS